MSRPRLELFVYGSTPVGKAACAHARRLCQERLGARADLVVFDLERAPLAAQQAQVLLVPALLRRDPAGDWRAFGDLSDLDATARALGLAGEAP